MKMTETIHLINQFIQIACLSAVTLLSARRSGWLFRLLTGAFGCYLLGDIFYMLHIWIYGQFPSGFSVAYLSYIGTYFFLLTIDLWLAGEWTDIQKKALRPNVRISLIAPAAVVILHLVYYIRDGGFFINLLFCVPLSLLAYYSLLMLLAGGAKSGLEPPSRRYHGAVLLYVLAENMMFLSSSLGSDAIYIAFDFIMSATLVITYRAAAKEAAA